MPRPCCPRIINAQPQNCRRVASGPEGTTEGSFGRDTSAPDASRLAVSGHAQEPGSVEPVVLTLDELEAIRLADLEGLYQEAAALLMGVSRQTFARIVAEARKKTALALVTGATIEIRGGNVRLRNQGISQRAGPGPANAQGDSIMKIAVPVAGKTIDGHFGHCAEYAVFTVEGKAIREETSLPSRQGCGCKSGIAPVLAEHGITLMIAGNIGNGAINVLASSGIKTIRGASGDARQAVEAYLAGVLADSGESCSAHGDHGDHGDHGADHVCSH